MTERPFLIIKHTSTRVAWVNRAPVVPDARLVFDLAAGNRVGGKAKDKDVARLIRKAQDIVDGAMAVYHERIVRPLLPV